MKTRLFAFAASLCVGSAIVSLTAGCGNRDASAAAPPLMTPSVSTPTPTPSIDADIESGDSAYTAQDWDRALTSYRTALRHSLPSGTNDQRGTSAYALLQVSRAHEKIAEHAYDSCDYQGAVDHLRAAIAVYPDNDTARTLLPTYIADLKWSKSGQEQGSQFMYDPASAQQVASANAAPTVASVPWIGGSGSLRNGYVATESNVSEPNTSDTVQAYYDRASTAYLDGSRCLAEGKKVQTGRPEGLVDWGRVNNDIAQINRCTNAIKVQLSRMDSGQKDKGLAYCGEMEGWSGALASQHNAAIFGPAANDMPMLGLMTGAGSSRPDPK